MDAVRTNLLEETYERIINVGFCIIPYEDLSDIIGPNPMVFGTTKDEKIFSFEGVDALFKSQFEQMGSMEPGLDRKRLATQISADENNAFIVEEITLTISSPEEVNTIFMRASCVMEYMESRWKLTHWHTSTPVDTENDPWHLEVWKREKEKLQKLVDQQTADLQLKNRELEVEAALERIRARTMAMQKSEELADVAFVLFEQLRGLGGNLWGTGFGLCEKDSDKDSFWFANENGVFPPVSIPNTVDPAHKKMYEGWKNKTEFLALEGSGKDLKNHYEYMMTLSEVRPFFQKILDEGLSFPEWQQWNAAYFTHGYLLIITLEPYPDKEILKRFARVFDQTYTRFLDLKKAEAQAREAKIEAALEKVRSRSLAMHKSDELNEVVSVLFEKLKDLQIPFTAVGIATGIEGSKDLNAFVCGDNAGGLVITNYRLPYFDNPIPKDLYNALEKQLDPFVGHYSKEEKDSFYEYVLEHTTEFRHLPEDIKRMIFESPIYKITHVAVKNANFNINDFEGKVLADHEVDIIKRFARVFDQAYTRFLDLQKAETQAREAQIEAALERVRSRSMGMHKSDDLIDVVREIGKGIHELGIQLHYSQIYTDYTYDPKTGLNIWVDVEGQDYLEKFHLPYIDHTITLNFYNALNEGLDYFSDRYSKAEKDSYFKLLFKYSDLKRIPKKRKELILNASGWTRFTVILNEATLNFGRYSLDEFTDEEHEIFIRFAKVFGQAYTRFLDLKKAEEQAREAQINLAVERVRARALAMFKSEEILEVVYKLKEEIMGLDIPNVTAATIHLKEPDGKYRAWDLTSISGDENELEISLDIRWYREDTHPDFFMREVWDRTEDYFVVIQGGDRYKHTVEWLHQNGHSDYAEEFQEFLESSQLEKAYHPTVPLNNGRMCIDLLDPPSPEIESILKKMAGAFDLAYKRFEDLQKAEAQTREAKIETALEKVRSRTMGMQRSDELAEVANVLFTEMNDLVHNLWTCGFVLCEKGREEDEWWLSLEDGFSRGFFLPNINDYAHATLYEGWLEGDSFRTVQLDGDKLQEHYDWLMEIPVAKNIFDDMEAAGMQRPEWQKLHAAYFSKGYLVIITREPCPEEEIFKRFAKVFDQTYTRFLDLQKAEEQAREAEIEASLERVRAKAMAMHSSKDIESATAVVFNELSRLGIDMERCGISLMNETPIGEIWSTPLSQESKEVVSVVTGYLDFGIHPILQQSYRDWREKKDFSAYKLVGNEVREYYAKLEKQPEYKFPKVANYPDQQILNTFYFKEGGIFAFTVDELSAEAKDIIQKFTKVFAQTYTRFLDIQKAEEQAREAKIETALEKVRSRTMGMQSSEELPGVANLMFLEVQALGIPAWSCGYCILLEDGKSSTCIMSSEGTLQKPFLLPHYGEVSFEEWDDFVQSEETFFTQELGGKAIESHYNFMKSLPQLTPIFREIEEAGLSLPTYQINHLCKISHGFLLFITYEQVPDAHDIFKRFTNVFEQTYTRFLDLKKAEQLATETARQSSLDRIRAEIGSMRSAEDLKQITPIIWDELKMLEIPFIRCGVFIIDEENEVSHTYLSTSQGDPIAALHLPFEDIPLVKNAVSSWKESKIYTEHWDQQDFSEWTQNLINQGFIDSKKKYEAGSAPATLDLHFLPFKHGMLYIGNTEPLSKKSLDLGQSMAKAFSVAYDRYEDFNKLEQAKQKIEEAFRELEAAKDQLVQQEKLASLGQLTAGIAHEIKNPLNFVNNFSEVSLEMVEEARHEIRDMRREFEDEKGESPLEGSAEAERRRGVSDEAKNETLSLILEILDDIEANLRKIHEHGTRADSIVKSMLQHSRGGDGKMEPTSLNPLVKEYVNLAFHGMRAGKDPINVDIDLDLDDSVGDVPLVAEDFSRVILNLCNNAFDAMREKINSELNIQNSKFSPKLIVRTHQTDNSISIEIEDNGPGIPEEIKDKIMQPFFTTKKGTQGTGLGLSITNDIVKAHGGVLTISTQAGKRTTFTIELPKSGL